MPPTSEIAALLAEDRWIRRLARQLVADPGAADDLVQEAYLTVLSGEGAAPRSPRAWLAGVVRNLWRDRARSGARRERRERASAKREATASTDELVAEVELRRRVTELLLALDEPERRALILRFFKDLSLPAIARSEGVAVSTVHARVERGLAELRARLDREHGGRREAWAAGLVTLARASTGTGIEVLAMASALKVAASVLVAAAGAIWWWSERGEGTAAGAGALAPEPPATAEIAPEVAPASRPGQREALASERPSVPMEAATEERAAISGRVLDEQGRGVGGVRVGWKDSRPHDEPAESNGTGGFELPLAGRPADVNESIVCLTPELVTLVPAWPFGDWTLVVAPRASFAGTVVDESGAPVAGSELAFRLRESLFRAVGLHALGLNESAWTTSSDAAGRFELADVAGGPGVVLVVRARGFVDTEVELPGTSDRSLVITLLRPAHARELTGIVLDPAGTPVPLASVSAGKEIVTTDASGRFALPWSGGTGRFLQDEHGAWREQGAAEGATLIALKTGYLPAQEALRERDLSLPFVLQLGPAPLSILGFVLDPQGRAIPGVVLWPGDPTRFGQESSVMADGTRFEQDGTVEDRLCERSLSAAITETDGSFELGCLMDRSYTILAFDPRTAARCGPWSIAAGARDVELVFTPEPTARVAGRVVTARGKPRAGLEVVPRRTQSWADGAEAPQLHGAQYGVKTDAEGRFEFEELAITGTSLFLSTPPCTFRVVELAGFPDLANVEIVEPEACEVQVELAGDPAGADAVRALDGNGAELETMEVTSGERSMMVSMGTEAKLVEGRSRLLLIQETARTLVLYKAGVEVLRLPIELEPGQRTVVRP